MKNNYTSSLHEDISDGNRSEALCRVLEEYSERKEITFHWLNKHLPLLNNAIDRQIFFNHFFRELLLNQPKFKKSLEDGVTGYVSGLVFENQDQLMGLVQNDALTGLLNRQGYLENIVKHMARHKRAKIDNFKDDAAMVFIDVNNFKNLNDTEGHAFGDEALKYVGEAIQDSTRTSDLQARYGGDEFVLFLDILRTTDVYSMDDFLNALSTRLNETLSKRLEKSGKKTNISLSIGIALYDHTDVSHIELLRRADQAMYYAKQNIEKTGSYYHLWNSEIEYIDKDERKGRESIKAV